MAYFQDWEMARAERERLKKASPPIPRTKA